MRILMVVQRYGVEVAGGAEAFCRDMATRMAGRGHSVEVVTSCATSYVDWDNVYQPGTVELDGVVVHRLPVDRPRDNELFGHLNARTIAGNRPVPLYMQREWMHMQGPSLPDLRPWLAAELGRFDIAVFFTYLYYSSWLGLPEASALAPTVLHPLAHDEPPIYLPLFGFLFQHPHGLAFLTEEERDLTYSRFRLRQPTVVTGTGVDLGARGDGRRFRAAHGMDEQPYLLFVGRLDPHKGTQELFEYFTTFKERNPGPLKLVMMGEPVHPLPVHADVIYTGHSDNQTKHDALDGCVALVQPSYFESFSMILAEAWVHARPALVQGRCAVLAGQARRSRGALPYSGFGEFEVGLELLLGDEQLRHSLGSSGRRYVESRYAWDEVLATYERFLTRISWAQAIGRS